ncbi:hypothetical protein Tco_0250079, partial [Tanacetum coccineum]
SLSSFITIAKGESSSIFTFFNLSAGAEIVLEAEELLLPRAGAGEGLFIMIPFKVQHQSASPVEEEGATD